MSSIREINIKRETLGHALADGNWAVPRYQRAYAWEERNVRELFSDFETAINDNQPEYFLGSIVVTQSASDRPEIVDGQQRLATISIFLAAVRDYLFGSDEKDTAKGIQGKFLLTDDIWTKDLTPKLKLNDVDHDFFQRTVLEPPTPGRKKIKPTRDSHRRIQDAQSIASEQVYKIASASGQPDQKLREWVDFLEKRALVIWVAVPDDLNAFTIFETLNDRGLDLAITDLLKNYLFHRSDNRIDEVQNRWISMFATVTSVASEEEVKHYIRHLWSSRNGLTRERELYLSIKQEVTTKNKAVQLADLMAQEAKLYAAMINTKHEFWNEFGTSARLHMDTLNLLGMERIRPLILAVLSGFSVKEAKRALKLLVSWGVRLLIAGSNAGSLEKNYSNRAVDIRNKAIQTAAQLQKAMRGLIPGDEDFKRAFAIAKVGKGWLARYYLQALERQSGGKDEPELIPNANEEEVNLEHVLPQNPAAGTWTAFDPESAAAYTNRLGNLALMRNKENSLSGNEEFPDKKKRYTNSDFILTKSIAGLSGWDPQAIEDRQSKLANLAVKTWPATV